MFPIVFLCYNNSCAAIGQPTFQTWLKLTLKKPSSVYNSYPSIISGVGIAMALLFAYLNDYLGGRKNVWFVSGFFVPLIIGCALLAKWNIPIDSTTSATFGRGTHLLGPAIYFFMDQPVIVPQ